MKKRKRKEGGMKQKKERGKEGGREGKDENKTNRRKRKSVKERIDKLENLKGWGCEKVCIHCKISHTAHKH